LLCVLSSPAQKSSRQAIVGLFPGPKEADQDSTDDEILTEDDLPTSHTPRGSNKSEHDTHLMLSELFSCDEVYGFSFHSPSPADVQLYERCSLIGDVLLCVLSENLPFPQVLFTNYL